MHELEGYPQNEGAISALAFDFGTQRIGVAYGQSLTATAQGVAVIKARDGIPDWDEIAELVAHWTPDVMVVGLPYNLDGSESELLLRAAKFARRLHGRFGKPCFGMDERLSSREAIERVIAGNETDNATGGKRSKRTNKKAAIDDIAAQIILENWFSELARVRENQEPRTETSST